MMRGRHFCFTTNNPTAVTTQKFKDLFEDESNVLYAVFAHEVAPTTGTPHLQGYVCFAERKRITSVRTLLSGSHVELARGTPKQAADYCKKTPGWIEFGDFSGVPFQGKRSDFDSFKTWLLEQDTWPTDAHIALNWTALYCRYGNKLKELRDLLYPSPNLETGPYSGWQLDLNQKLKEPAVCDRSIEFFVDEPGGSGKSWFIRKFLTDNVDAQFFSVGKRDDIAHAVDITKRVFLFNIPRDHMQYLQYGILESIKDRLIFSPKYMSQTKMLVHKPHVIVFCNEQPDYEKLSEDRIVVHDVTTLTPVE